MTTIEPTIVMIKGSRSDRSFCNDTGKYLQNNGIRVIHRTGSAHRTSKHVLSIVSEYNNSDIIGYVPVAGLSDGLSGVVAANTEKSVFPYPPDLAKYGEAKIFSSTKLPKGIKVSLASSPEELLQLIQNASQPIYSPTELADRKMKIAETYFTDNEDRGIKTPLGLPLLDKGKTREVYDLGLELLINASDRISAFDKICEKEIEGKGVSLTQESAFWFPKTRHIIQNHYVDMPDVSMIRVTKAKPILIEWVLRGYMYGSMWRQYEKGKRDLYGYKLQNGLRLAEKLPEVMLTPTTKAKVGHDEPITKDGAIDLKLVTADEWRVLEETSFKLYEFYNTEAQQRGLIIPDFKLEFGRVDGSLIQIDEAPNHDSARKWIKKMYEIGKRQEGWCADKEFARQWWIDSGIDPDNPPEILPAPPEPIVEQIQMRLEMHEVFTKDRSIDSFKLRSLEDVEMELGIKVKE